jgi:hypothetical protein
MTPGRPFAGARPGVVGNGLATEVSRSRQWPMLGFALIGLDDDIEGDEPC